MTMTQMNHQSNALQQARALQLPPREAMLQRAVSVQAFWDNNRKLLEQAWTQWESDADVLVPDETLLDSHLRQAINDAWLVGWL